MRLDIIAGGTCDSNDCPTIFATDNGMVAVQGAHLPQVTTPAGEIVALIPAALILEAAHALGD
jgi:hypothetical protein